MSDKLTTYQLSFDGITAVDAHSLEEAEFILRSALDFLEVQKNKKIILYNVMSISKCEVL